MSAATVVSNLSNAVVPDIALGTGFFPEDSGAEVRVAVPFVTGPSAATLNSVDLRLDSSAGGSAALQVAIYSDSTTQPGELPNAQVEFLSGVTVPALDQVYTYTSTGLNLNASTRYWIVLSTANTGLANTFHFWRVTGDLSESSAYGWSIGDGATAYSSLAGGWYTVSETDTDTPGLFAVNATIVPEPAALGLLSLGGLIARRRRAR